MFVSFGRAPLRRGCRRRQPSPPDQRQALRPGEGAHEAGKPHQRRGDGVGWLAPGGTPGPRGPAAGARVAPGEPRSEVVGSLLRPPELVDARTRAEAGQMPSAEFKRIEDRAVDAAVALQEEAGIDVITDGELRRYAFFGHLVEAFDGFDKQGGWAIPFRDETGDELVLRRPVVVQRLRWRRSMCAEEWAYLRARAERPGKVTMLSAQ